MFRKIVSVILLALFLIPNSAFAVDRDKLNLEFFKRFNDDCLYYYVNQAVENNHSAKETTLKVEQYREQVKSSFGKELPSFSVGANYLGAKVPKIDNFAIKKNAFILPFFANYEADFLLKNRDKTKSVKKDCEAAEFEERAVYISLLADVATVYTNILHYDELLVLAGENVDICSKILKHDEKKLKRGVISSVQYNTSLKNLQTAKNSFENIKKQQEILLMQLAVLTGVSPDNAQSLQRGNINEFEYLGSIPTDIDSDVIFSRPDVLASEAKLEKAKIDIRVARKEFLPTFNISGVWIFNTIAPGTFFSWDSSLAAILAGATQDIFMGGRKIANLKIQKAKYQQLFEQYKQTDLDAVKEVNSALCFIKYDFEVDNNTKKKLNSEYSNLTSANQKLKRGVISEPEYLNNLTSFINIQNEAVNTKTQRIVNYYTLYKAVGGQL